MRRGRSAVGRRTRSEADECRVNVSFSAAIITRLQRRSWALNTHNSSLKRTHTKAQKSWRLLWPRFVANGRESVSCPLRKGLALKQHWQMSSGHARDDVGVDADDHMQNVLFNNPSTLSAFMVHCGQRRVDEEGKITDVLLYYCIRGACASVSYHRRPARENAQTSTAKR